MTAQSAGCPIETLGHDSPICQEHGLVGYVAILTSRFGDVVEFEPFKSKSPREARAMLCGTASGV
jgi:hypothetical protein